MAMRNTDKPRPSGSQTWGSLHMLAGSNCRSNAILLTLGIHRAGPLEIHLDSLKINVENLHQAGDIVAS
jgi:hypothetical protein